MERYKRLRYRIRYVTNRLRMHRAGRRWSQGEVAERLGHLSRFRYWQIENEEAEPTAKERAKLARLFRCSEAELFPRKRRSEAAAS